MTHRIYRITADSAQVDAAGVPPRPPDRRLVHVVWDLPDEELDDLPTLRRWMREQGITDTDEYGLVVPGERLPGHGEPYGLAGLPWSSWTGPTLTRSSPCAACGLPVTTVAPGGEGDAAPDPLTFLVGPDCLAAAPGLIGELRAAGLDTGLVTHPFGDRLLLSSDVPLGGPAYPFGPRPCVACGRASRPFRGERVFARPRYAYLLTFDRCPAAHWVWSTVYGQQMPLVSREVAAHLRRLVPGIRFLPHGRPDDPGAFLPERHRTQED